MRILSSIVCSLGILQPSVNIEKIDPKNPNHVDAVYEICKPNRHKLLDPDESCKDAISEYINKIEGKPAGPILEKYDCFNLAIATKNEKPVGYITYGTFHGSQLGNIGTIAVAEDMKKQGVGSKLLGHAEQEMKNKNIPSYFALIYGNNEASIQFFKKHGYTYQKNFGAVVITDAEGVSYLTTTDAYQKHE